MKKTALLLLLLFVLSGCGLYDAGSEDTTQYWDPLAPIFVDGEGNITAVGDLPDETRLYQQIEERKIQDLCTERWGKNSTIIHRVISEIDTEQKTVNLEHFWVPVASAEQILGWLEVYDHPGDSFGIALTEWGPNGAYGPDGTAVKTAEEVLTELLKNHPEEEFMLINIKGDHYLLSDDNKLYSLQDLKGTDHISIEGDHVFQKWYQDAAVVSAGRILCQ